MTAFRLARGSIMTPGVLSSETILVRRDTMEALLCGAYMVVDACATYRWDHCRNLWLPVCAQVMVVDVYNHRGCDPGRDFWRSLRHHQVAPPRRDIDVDFDGRGTAGSKGVPIDESSDDDLPPLGESSDDDQD